MGCLCEIVPIDSFADFLPLLVVEVLLLSLTGMTVPNFIAVGPRSDHLPCLSLVLIEVWSCYCFCTRNCRWEYCSGRLEDNYVFTVAMSIATVAVDLLCPPSTSVLEISS